MKYFSLLLLALVSCSFVACDNEDNIPNQLIGTWEERYFVDSVDYWIVNSYDFINDSVYQFQTTVRDTENGSDLGYRYLYDDKYQWDGVTFSYLPDLVYWIDMDADGFYVPKENLVAGVVDYFHAPTANISIVENGKKMIFQNNCPKQLNCDPPSEPRIYLKAK